VARDFSARIMRGDRFGIVGLNGAGNHPLLDHAKRVLDRLAASVENVWRLRHAGLHSIQNGLVLKTRHGAD
jgi:ATPase subunit of ABC transporter with duplicated ATPase domains